MPVFVDIMDSFVVRVSDGDRQKIEKAVGLPKSKSGTKTTTKERHAQFPRETHVAGEKLFCTICNVVLDHTRKSSVASHIDGRLLSTR